MARGGNVRIQITADADGVRRGTAEAERALDRLNSVGARSMNALKTGAVAAAGVGLYALVDGLKDSVNEALEAEKATKQTEAVLKSTGHAANVTASHIGQLSEALAYKAGIDDEAIQQSQNLLLTFTNVRNEAGRGNDIFDQSSKVILDMSAALGTDLKGATIQVGKALNDPIKGITALQRVGVSFTQQQRAQIKTLVESGKTMDAQKLILKELNKEFAGSAQAQRDPFKALKVSVDNLKEELGKSLLPVLTQAAAGLARFFNQMRTGEGTGGRFASALRSAFETVRGAVQRALGAANNFIREHQQELKTIGTAVSFLGQTLAMIWNGNVLPTIRRAISGIVQALSGLISVITGIVKVVKGIINGEWSQVWDGLKDIVSGALRMALGALRAMTAPLRQILSSIGNFIEDAFTSAWDAVKSAFRSAINSVVSALRSAVNSVGNAAEKVASAIESAFNAIGDIVSVVSSAMGKVVSFIAAAASRAANAAESVVEAVVDALSNLAGRIVTVGGKVASTIVGWGSAFLSAGAQAGKQLISGIINSVAGLPAKLAEKGREAASAFRNAIKSLPGKALDAINPFAVGGKVSGPQLALVGEGAGPEYIIPTEPAYRQRAIGLLAAAAQDLGVAAFAKGGVAGSKKKAARHSARFARQVQRIEDWEKRYDQMDREYDLSEEDYIDEGDENTPPSIDQGAIDQRAGELAKLAAKKDQIRKEQKAAKKTAETLVDEYREIISRLKASLAKAKKKENRAKLKEQIEEYTGKLGDFKDAAHDLKFDITDTGLDIKELRGEAGALKPGGAVYAEFAKYLSDSDDTTSTSADTSSSDTSTSSSDTSTDTSTDSSSTSEDDSDLQAQLQQAEMQAYVAQQSAALSDAFIQTALSTGDIATGNQGTAAQIVIQSLVPTDTSSLSTIAQVVASAIGTQGSVSSSTVVTGV